MSNSQIPTISCYELVANLPPHLQDLIRRKEERFESKLREQGLIYPEVEVDLITPLVGAILCGLGTVLVTTLHTFIPTGIDPISGYMAGFVFVVVGAGVAIVKIVMIFCKHMNKEWREHKLNKFRSEYLCILIVRSLKKLQPIAHNEMIAVVEPRRKMVHIFRQQEQGMARLSRKYQTTESEEGKKIVVDVCTHEMAWFQGITFLTLETLKQRWSHTRDGSEVGGDMTIASN